MPFTSFVIDGGWTCSAMARSPSEGLSSLSIEASIDACAGDTPVSAE
jgi:hypothetical protein